MKILIVHLKTKGLSHDSIILSAAFHQINNQILKKNIEIFAYELPGKTINHEDYSVPGLNNGFTPDLVIHLEAIYRLENISFDKCDHIFIPNPEWIPGISIHRLDKMSEIWHKTKYSYNFFVENSGNITSHKYLGFTSMDFGFRVNNFRSVAHFFGKTTIFRNSEKILNIWTRRTDFPTLRMRFYRDDMPLFGSSTWFQSKNIFMKIGIDSDQSFYADLSESGIHICTSEMEGFGHYINECRSMGGVPIVINGEPMNELVDQHSGYLIEPISVEMRKCARRFKITESALETTLEGIFSSDIDELVLKGKNSRLRFEKERLLFLNNLLKLIENRFPK